ncbi:hypothetical protein A9G17_12165 [Gilliamella sp. wkB7]|uniref:toxin VasX n=1 Tax=Gilliamella sp. wkB7 TaxID=3120264 RepID=UPI000810A742|nr:toxin VasX [Gilliamella apicola]OCF93813.1 hypothetical protein A9G17_12165 [Gilliamella apicola]
MKKTENIAKENQNEAKGNCLACGRVGIPVFLLRQAVVKTQSLLTKSIDPIYQELADYTKTLDFNNRKPEIELEYYSYVLRTLRDGYVYVMHQLDDDINSRIFHVYECIEGALRLKKLYELTNTQPRPISKACKNACHTIPASFINLQEHYTYAWVAYTSQPWSEKTINDYLKQQDSNILSRFTKINIKQFKDSPAEATGNRSVPFKDIFGSNYQESNNDDSKVLEFRFGEQGLNNFESVHPFISLKSQKQKYAIHASQLYSGDKPISCGVVLEDTFGIAQELNSQRLSQLHIFTNQEDNKNNQKSDLNDQQCDVVSLKDATQVYQKRGEQLYKSVNPILKKRFKYYQSDMFKKRTILQFIENYRTSVENAYDTEIARLQEWYDYIKNIDAAHDSGNDFLDKAQNDIAKAESDKAEKIKKINEQLDNKKIDSFKGELETAFADIEKYYQEWSQDYFTYVRWLFGNAQFVSKYSKIKPTTFNQAPFWQQEFDFSTSIRALSYIKEVLQILLDSTHAEVRLDEDNALWDELLSNHNSIFYVIEHQNNQGINIDAPAFVNLDNNTLLKWRDVISNSTGLVLAYNTYQAEKTQNTQTDKEKELQKAKERVELDIEKKRQEINAKQEELNNNRKYNPQEHAKLQKIRDQKIKELKQLNEHLASINHQLAEMVEGNSVMTDVGKNRYLHQQALKKYSILRTHKQFQPIEPRLKQLDSLAYLGDIGAYPVEFTKKVRPEKIRQVYALLTQLQGELFRENSLTGPEIAFLEKFDVTDAKYDVGVKKPTTQTLKFTLCFPDEVSKGLVVGFLKNKEIVNPNDFKNFLATKMPDYVTLVNRQAVLEGKIDITNRQKASNDEAIHQSNQNKRDDKTREYEIKKETEAMNKKKNEKIKIEQNQSRTEQAKRTRQNVKAARLNYTVNAVMGVITMLNILDDIKALDKIEEGKTQKQKQLKLAIDLSSLALLSVDTVAIYRDIKLQMQLLKAMRSTTAKASIPEIKNLLKSNGIISKSIAEAFAFITVLEALGELKSAFGMWNMEDKSYFIYRVIGASILGIGAVFLLATSSLAIGGGVILLLIGIYLIGMSKKYDNFTPIDHWLNRCYFGVHKEFDFLGYDAYHEEQNSFVGFGHSVNDYLVAISGIDTFMIFKKPSLYNGMKLYHRHIYFYLQYLDYTFISNKSLQASVRLFGKNDQSNADFIEFNFNINSTKINKYPAPNDNILIHTNEDKDKETLKIRDYVTSQKSYFVERYESKSFKTIINRKAIRESNFNDIEKVELKSSTPNQPKSDLTAITWVAGTFACDLVKSYQINIYTDTTDCNEIPLIINRDSNKFHDE